MGSKQGSASQESLQEHKWNSEFRHVAKDTGSQPGCSMSLLGTIGLGLGQYRNHL